MCTHVHAYLHCTGPRSVPAHAAPDVCRNQQNTERLIREPGSPVRMAEGRSSPCVWLQLRGRGDTTLDLPRGSYGSDMGMAVPWEGPDQLSSFFGDCPPPPLQLSSQSWLERASGCSSLGTLGHQWGAAVPGSRDRGAVLCPGADREEGSPEELGLSKGLLEVLMGRGWG